MSESTHIDPRFENQDPDFQPPVQHSGNLEGNMQERPAYPQQGPLGEQILPVPETSADIPQTQETSAPWYKRRLVVIGAAVGAVLAGGGYGLYASNAGGGGHVSAESLPTPSHRADTEPAKSAEAPASPKASESTSPSHVALPAGTAPASPAETTSAAPSDGGLTQEQLNTMQPLVVKYSESANTGSPEVIKELYKDLQYADQTGRVDFLTAAIGQDNMGSTLGTEYLNDINQFQQWFQLHPDERLSFEYVPSDIKPDPSVTTPTYNLIVTQKTGDTVQKYAQAITLKTVTDTEGNISWIISSVDAAVPVN